MWWLSPLPTSHSLVVVFTPVSCCCSHQVWSSKIVCYWAMIWFGAVFDGTCRLLCLHSLTVSINKNTVSREGLVQVYMTLWFWRMLFWSALVCCLNSSRWADLITIQNYKPPPRYSSKSSLISEDIWDLVKCYTLPWHAGNLKFKQINLPSSVCRLANCSETGSGFDVNWNK